MTSDKRLTGFPVNSVAVVLGYETQNGIEEVVHVIDGKRCDIISVQHGIERKTMAKKNDRGDIESYEPTGEEILLLKVRYIRG